MDELSQILCKLMINEGLHKVLIFGYMGTAMVFLSIIKSHLFRELTIVDWSVLNALDVVYNAFLYNLCTPDISLFHYQRWFSNNERYNTFS